MLEYLVNQGISKDKLLIVPPPPCFDEDWKAAAEQKFGVPLSAPPKTKALVKLYHEASLKLASEHGCHRVEGLWETLDHRDLFCDGLHFSEKGAKTMAGELIL